MTINKINAKVESNKACDTHKRNCGEHHSLFNSMKDLSCIRERRMNVFFLVRLAGWSSTSLWQRLNNGDARVGPGLDAKLGPTVTSTERLNKGRTNNDDGPLLVGESSMERGRRWHSWCVGLRSFWVWILWWRWKAELDLSLHN